MSTTLEIYILTSFYTSDKTKRSESDCMISNTLLILSKNFYTHKDTSKEIITPRPAQDLTEVAQKVLDVNHSD